MSASQSSSGSNARARMSWTLFGVVAALGVGACVLAALSTGSRTDVGLTFLGGLIVVGIAAALVSSIVSPLQDHDGGRRAGYESGGFSSDGGGFGGSDCGGGGGDGGC